MSLWEANANNSLTALQRDLQPARRDPAGPWEAFTTQAETSAMQTWVGEADRRRRNLLEEDIRRFEDLSGRKVDMPAPAGSGDITDPMAFRDQMGFDEQREALRRELEDYRAEDPQTADTFDLDYESQVRQTYEEAQAEAQEVARASGGWASAAGVAGAFGGAMADPVLLAASAVAGIGFIGRGTTLARGVTAEAAIGAGLETAAQPSIAEQTELAGLDYGFDDAVFNVLAAGAGSAALYAGMRAVPPALRTVGKGTTALNKLRQGYYRLDPKQRAVVDFLDREVDFARNSPFRVGGSETAMTHLANMDRATESLISGRPVEGVWTDLTNVNFEPLRTRPRTVEVAAELIEDPQERQLFLDTIDNARQQMLEGTRQQADTAQSLLARQVRDEAFDAEDALSRVRELDAEAGRQADELGRTVTTMREAAATLRRGGVPDDVSVFRDYLGPGAYRDLKALYDELAQTPGRKRANELRSQIRETLEAVDRGVSVGPNMPRDITTLRGRVTDEAYTELERISRTLSRSDVSPRRRKRLEQRATSILREEGQRLSLTGRLEAEAERLREQAESIASARTADQGMRRAAQDQVRSAMRNSRPYRDEWQRNTTQIAREAAQKRRRVMEEPSYMPPEAFYTQTPYKAAVQDFGRAEVAATERAARTREADFDAMLYTLREEAAPSEDVQRLETDLAAARAGEPIQAETRAEIEGVRDAELEAELQRRVAEARERAGTADAADKPLALTDPVTGDVRSVTLRQALDELDEETAALDMFRECRGG